MELTSTNIAKIHLKVERFAQNTYWTLAEDLKLPKGQGTLHVPREDKRKKEKKKRNREGTCASRRELWRRKGSFTLGRLLTGGEICLDGGELWSLRGEHSNRCAEGKMESDLHRRSVPPPLHSATWGHSSAGAGRGWVLKFRFQWSDLGRAPGLAAWRQPEEAGV